MLQQFTVSDEEDHPEISPECRLICNVGRRGIGVTALPSKSQRKLRFRYDYLGSVITDEAYYDNGLEGS